MCIPRTLLKLMPSGQKYLNTIILSLEMLIPIYMDELLLLRPCHGAESHLAISSGAGLRAGWEPYLRLHGSKSSSGSLALMDTTFGFGSGSMALAP